MTIRQFVRRPCGLMGSWMRASSPGQALVEMALVVPFLLAIALNVVNFGYLFLVAVNLAASPRSGALYSILGSATPASSQPNFPGMPAAGPTGTNTSVSNLSLNDLNGALYQGTSAGIQVCTSVGAPSTWTPSSPAPCTSYNTAKCSNCTPDLDLEEPATPFVLNRVDVTYTFYPLIPGFAFNLFAQVVPVCGQSGECTFHRMAEMREMN